MCVWVCACRECVLWCVHAVCMCVCVGVCVCKGSCVCVGVCGGVCGGVHACRVCACV